MSKLIKLLIIVIILAAILFYLYDAGGPQPMSQQNIPLENPTARGE